MKRHGNQMKSNLWPASYSIFLPVTAADKAPYNGRDGNHYHEWCYCHIQHTPFWKRIEIQTIRMDKYLKGDVYIIMVICPSCKLLSYFTHAFLTTVAFSVAQLDSDEVFHPERVADTATGKWITLSVAGAIQLANCIHNPWKHDDTSTAEGGLMAKQMRVTVNGKCWSHALLLTDCVYLPGLEDKEVIFLLAKFVTESCGNTVTWQWWAPGSSRHQEH